MGLSLVGIEDQYTATRYPPKSRRDLGGGVCTAACQPGLPATCLLCTRLVDLMRHGTTQAGQFVVSHLLTPYLQRFKSLLRSLIVAVKT